MSAATAVAPALAGLGAPWFTEVLGTDVDAVRVEPVAFTGATTDMARVHLAYRGPDAGPATVVAKITGTDAVRAGMDAAMGLFAREACFYTTFAGRVPMRTARCFYAGDGASTPLLLEDLGCLRMGDQVQGLTVADAQAILDAVARLHARYWQAPDLDADWLVRPAEGAYAGMVAQLVASGAEPLQERFAGRVPASALEGVAAHAGDWTQVLVRGAQGPHTLVHNDCRLDNVFFDDAAGGEPVLIDWQILARTRGTQDVANLLAQSMDADVLTAHWEALLRRYHDALCEHGVRGYSWEECLTHYRQNVPYAVGAAMALLGAMDIGDGRGLGEAIALRALHHIADVDAFGAF